METGDRVTFEPMRNTGDNVRYMSMLCTMAIECSEDTKAAALGHLEEAVRSDARRRRSCRDRSVEAATHVRPWPVG